MSSVMARPLREISTSGTSHCNSISSLWKRVYIEIDQYISVFVCLFSAKIVEMQVRPPREPVNFRLFPVKFFGSLNRWTWTVVVLRVIDESTRACLDRARLLTKKYALTEREMEIWIGSARNCFFRFDYSTLEISGYFVNFGTLFWQSPVLRLCISIIMIERWTKNHQT